jgi:hypothetical protein
MGKPFTKLPAVYDVPIQYQSAETAITKSLAIVNLSVVHYYILNPFPDLQEGVPGHRNQLIHWINGYLQTV